MAKARESVLNPGISGRLGDTVYVQTPYGTVLRNRPSRVAPPTPVQLEGRQRVATIGDQWNALDPAAMAAWRAYAESLEETTPAMRRGPTRGYNAFFALASRLLQIDPAAAIPTLPPTGHFGGDAVSITVSPSQSGSSLRGGQGGEQCEAIQLASVGSADGVESLSVDRSTPTLPSTWEATPNDSSSTVFASPPSADPPKGEAVGVTFSANRGNAPGVLTELLLQPLANGGRLPIASKYRSQGFVAFGAELEATVEAAKGWYACAYRFVEASTGRATALFPCGIVRVG